MSMWVRGALTGAVLVAVLAGCGDGGGGGGDGGSGPGVIGGSDGDGRAPAPVLGDARQVSEALPSRVSLGEGWGATRSPRVRDGAETARACQVFSGTSCSGVLAGGDTKFMRNGQAAHAAFAEFSMYAVDTPENAKVVYAAMRTATGQKTYGGVTRLSVDAGADETHAYADDDGPHALVRVGGVVAFVETRSDGLDEAAARDQLERLARVQVERVRKVAAGENPDA
ncbi:hypothetical protein [Streptomyces sp. NPDC057702]|uniref:hypothetical protein n=1 Tax=unclassified Streptomyces TaxID=2593676 RepID=UPI003677A58C